MGDNFNNISGTIVNRSNIHVNYGEIQSNHSAELASAVKELTDYVEQQGNDDATKQISLLVSELSKQSPNRPAIRESFRRLTTLLPHADKLVGIIDKIQAWF